MVKIVFCLPGKSYSREFLLSWTDLIMQTASRGHQVAVSQQLTRENCVAPIVGTEYDFAMFISSDIVFRPGDFFSLLESPHDVTAGLYLKEPTLANPEPSFEGTSFNPDNIVSDNYIKVDKSAFGWLLLQKSVVESTDMSVWNKSEYVGEVYIDTKVRVGHRVEIVI
jgi:hypothetical protein